MMNRLLVGKNAIITGARKGIGRAIVEEYAKNGANIWACSHTKSEDFENDMKSLEQKYDVRIWPEYFDLRNTEEIKTGIKRIISSQYDIHILVNNAGIAYRGLLQMTPMNMVRDVFEVDFFAPFFIIQQVTKKMKKVKGASIINIASTAGIDADAGRSAYGSAKAALICLTKVVSEEYGKDGVRANAIAPGITETDALSYNEEMLKEFVDHSLLKEIGKPNNIADAALYLASDLSSYITGQVLRVDGGVL